MTKGGRKPCKPIKYHVTETCSLPVISVKIGNINFNALLDSGASVSLISNKAIKQIPQTLIRPTNSNPNIKITTLDGSEIKIQYSASVPIVVAQNLVNYNFLITNTDIGRSYDLILGFDFLSKFQCKINFQDKTVSLKGGKAQICKYEAHNVNVVLIDIIARLAKKVKIGPKKSAVVEIKLDHKILPGN